MATIKITAETVNQEITVYWDISGTQLSHYPGVKLIINELNTKSGQYTIPVTFDTTNYSQGSYTIVKLNGAYLEKNTSYSIYETLTSKTGYKPKKSTSVIVEILQSEPNAPVLEVSGGDSIIKVKVTNMYDSSANQGYTPVTDMWLTIVNDSTGEENTYIYPNTSDASYNDPSGNTTTFKQYYFDDYTIAIEASNNILYEGTVTLFNAKGSSSDVSFNVTPSNVPKPVQNLEAYPTVMYNNVKGLTTDASSISVFWQKSSNYDVLVSDTVNKPITSYVITRTDSFGNVIDMSFNVNNKVDPNAIANATDASFNNKIFDYRYIDTNVVVGKQYYYSIVLRNENGYSNTNPSSSSVTCGSLPSKPIFSLDPSDNKFTFNLETGSSLNGFDQSANKLYTLNFNYDSTSNASAIFDLSAGSLVTMTNLPSNNTLNNGISIMNGTTYQLTMYASTTYSINGLTTIFTSDPYILSVRPYGIPSAPSNVLVFSLDSSNIPVIDASGNPGLKVSWGNVTGTNLQGNTNATYSVYVNGYLSNIQNVDNSAGNYIVSSYTYAGASTKLLLGTKYSIYVVTKTTNSYYNKTVYSNEIPTVNYYSGTPLTYPSPVTNISLTNLSASTMQVNFTDVSGNDTGGFATANIQYTFELRDLSTNSVIADAGAITNGSKTFNSLTAGTPYKITVYTQGIYTSTDTSSNSTSTVPFFNGVVVKNNSETAVATKILYYTPAAPQNVIVNATYISGVHGAKLSWSSPSGLVNNISNGVKLTNYLIYCVDASYNGSLDTVEPVTSTVIEVTTTTINQYSPALNTKLSMDLSGNYKVYVLAKGSIGGYTTNSGYSFDIETIYGNKSENMYNRLLENPLTSLPISHITTFKSPSVPTLASTSDSSGVIIKWILDPTVTEYIIYKGPITNNTYTKYFLNNGSFAGLTLTTEDQGFTYVNYIVSSTNTYYVTAISNNVESDSNSIYAETGNNVPSIVTNRYFSLGDANITINWTSPSDLGSAGGTNSNLFTQINLYNSSNSEVASKVFSNITATSQTYSHNFSGLDNNTIYSATIYSYYYVNNISTSVVNSIEVEVTGMIPNKPPADATDLSATTGDSSITLNWTNPTDYGIYPFDASFTIVRTGKRGDGISSSMVDASFSILSSATSYTDTNVNNGYKYTYTLIAKRNGTVVTSNTTTTTTLQPSGITIENVIPSGKPQFASAISSSNNGLTYTVTIDRNGSNLTGSSFIGIPTNPSATALLFDSSNNVFNSITYVSTIPGGGTTSEVLAGQLYTYTFGFGQTVSAVFLAVSNANGMVTGTNSSTSFTLASNTSLNTP